MSTLAAEVLELNRLLTEAHGQYESAEEWAAAVDAQHQKLVELAREDKVGDRYAFLRVAFTDKTYLDKIEEALDGVMDIGTLEDSATPEEFDALTDRVLAFLTERGLWPIPQVSEAQP